ncbi:MAG TPA: hypothetical protein VJ302_24980 [Blastocatellia bacterium]|nr:hypothetical protein [Blastocatellia bacterium]
MKERSIRIFLALMVAVVMCGLYIYFAASIGASGREMVPPPPVAIGLICLGLAVALGFWRLSGERQRTAFGLIGMSNAIALLFLQYYSLWPAMASEVLSLSIVCVAILWPRRRSNSSPPDDRRRLPTIPPVK